MMLTLGQAAKEARVAKATISRAIATGRLSATRNDTNGYSIDPAELFRVFPRDRANSAGNGAAERSETPDETPALRAEIDGLKALLASMRDQLDDVRDQRDGWQKQAEAAQKQVDIAQRLIADQRPAIPPAPVRRGLFGWLKAS